MIRLLLLLILTVLPVPAFSQDTVGPLVRTALDEDTTTPGQPLVFRVTILVPTWMPAPPVFPNFEAPNVVVRLPSRASGPTSERINGTTWSGVTRSYRLYPMIPGRIDIPAGDIKITYADPETSKPVVVEVATAGFAIFGELPLGTENLKPFLAAGSLQLDRQVEGDAEPLTAGDAITLTTRVEVSGVSPMIIPPLTDALALDGLSIYPKEPVLAEKQDRGNLSGSRTEVLTVLAENAGTYEIPEISLSWYNLSKRKVETATVPAVRFTVAGPAPSEPAPSAKQPLNFYLLWGAGLAVLAGALFLVVRKLGPPLARATRNLLAEIRASEPYAYHQFNRALKEQDYSSATRTGLIWRQRIETRTGTAPDWRNLENALTNLGSNLFDDRAPRAMNSTSARWKAVKGAAADVRKSHLSHSRAQAGKTLPRLNPVKHQR